VHQIPDVMRKLVQIMSGTSFTKNIQWCPCMLSKSTFKKL